MRSGHLEVLRIRRVVGRGLAADLGARVEVAAVPVDPARPVALGDEEVELLRLRHRDLGMQAQVVVQAARAALLRPDDDQVGQRAGSRAGRVGRLRGGLWGGTGGRRVRRRHGARGGLHCTRRVQAAIPASRAARNARLCALGLAQQARGAARRRPSRRPSEIAAGRRPQGAPCRKRGRPREDQAQAPAPERLVVDRPRAPPGARPQAGHVLDARAGPPDLPDRERVGDQQDALGRLLGPVQRVPDRGFVGTEGEDERGRASAG